MQSLTPCAICGKNVAIYDSYLARIELMADPSTEPLLSDDGSGDCAATLQELLKTLNNVSADDAMDHVHRRFEYRLCRSCHREVLANPLGLPRACAALVECHN